MDKKPTIRQLRDNCYQALDDGNVRSAIGCVWDAIFALERQCTTEPPDVEATPFERDRAISLIVERVRLIKAVNPQLSPRFGEWAASLTRGSTNPRDSDFEPAIALAFQAFMTGRESMTGE